MAFTEVEIPKPKPVVENKNLEDCDTETNWMNLDEDIIKLSKSKEKASERDLTPDELGKKMFNDHFCCAVSIQRILTLIVLFTTIPTFANGADPDQMASEESTLFVIQFVNLNENII